MAGTPTHLEAPARRWLFGPVVLDERTLELSVNGEVVTVERKPLEVLLFLLHHAGEVVTKDEILEAVWPGRILTETVLTKAIGRIREAIGDDEQALIKTQHGYGYRLIAPVKVEASATPSPPRFDFKPGDSPPLRPRWKLEERLGTGGHGEAWLARHEKTKEARVYKFALDSTALGSLKREITIYRLLHDALPERTDFVSILDWNLEEPPYFLEIEHAGQNLVQWAESQGGLPNVPLQTRLNIVTQIAEALAAAHSVGVLHKDLKPSNVLVEKSLPPQGAENVRIKLADFGSGGVLDPGRLEALGITRMGFTQTVRTDPTTSGTPIYFAPEVIGGQPFTVQSDIYALGVILYQLVVGDLKKPSATGWERTVQDELLREDIVAATEGSLALRLSDAAVLAKRLRTLQERRTQREAERARQDEVKRAQLEAERSRQLVERLRSRRRWLRALVAVLFIGVTVSTGMYFLAQAAREDAEQSAATTRAVIGFLTGDVLSVYDHRTGLVRKDITIREALENAAGKVSDRFSGKPGVAANVHFAIADAYMSLGDAVAGQRQIDKADELLTSIEGPIADWQVLLWFLKTYGPSVRHMIEFSDEFCRTLQRFVQRGVKDTWGPEAGRQIRMVAAICRASDGQLNRSRQQFEEILDEALRSDPPDHGTAMSLESLLAGLSYIEGDFVAAERHVRNEVVHTVAELGGDHHHTIGRRLQLVHPLTLLGRFEEAAQELRDIEAIVTDAYPNRFRVASAVASLKFEQGHLKDAEEHLLSCLKQLEQQQQHDDDAELRRASVFGRIRLGETYLREGQVAKAVEELRYALASYQAPDPVVGAFDRRALLDARVSLADALRQADAPAAWQALREAAVQLHTLPDKHPVFASMRRVQGLLWQQEGEYAQAKAALQDALEIFELRYGSESWRTKRAREELKSVRATSVGRVAKSS